MVEHSLGWGKKMGVYLEETPLTVSSLEDGAQLTTYLFPKTRPYLRKINKTKTFIIYFLSLSLSVLTLLSLSLCL